MLLNKLKSWNFIIIHTDILPWQPGPKKKKVCFHLWLDSEIQQTINVWVGKFKMLIATPHHISNDNLQESSVGLWCITLQRCVFKPNSHAQVYISYSCPIWPAEILTVCSYLWLANFKTHWKNYLWWQKPLAISFLLAL